MPVRMGVDDGNRLAMCKNLFRGMLDSLVILFAAVLIAANTGFLPVAETQRSASAVFGQCFTIPCPEWCITTYWVQETEQSGYWTTGTCLIPGGQMVGSCVGLCGVCPVWYRCNGWTYELFMPCSCTGGC